MLRFLRGTIAVALGAWTTVQASAFSLLGPLETWQVAAIGYNLGGDIGGPHNLGEEYRWNIRTITYGFDESFLNYFGSSGSNAVIQAIQIFNNLPPVSQMSSNLSEFPLDTRRVNFQAAALNILDMKSVTMNLLCEEMGLADPERWTWSLRSRQVFPTFTNYSVIHRNFDPVTWAPSSFVNGNLLTYFIVDFNPTIAFSDAGESPVDPLSTFGSAVATFSATLGEFRIGLTRDDIGGLRYLLRTNNVQFEQLVPGSVGVVTPPPPGSPAGTPPSTNPVVNISVRPGVDKINFVQARYDSIIGTYIAVTNQYLDIYITNSTAFTQAVSRVVAVAPEIVFAAQDLGVTVGGSAVIALRNTAAAPNWVNNDAINGRAALAGPGVIMAPGTNTVPITITFNKVGQVILNQNPGFLDELNAVDIGYVWGSFDGTTNPPIIYPSFISIQDLEYQVLNPNP